MTTTYEKADKSVVSVMSSMMKKFHPDLVKEDVTVDVLMAYNPDDYPVKRSGVPCAAVVRVMPLKQRVKGASDAEVCIDAGQWKELSPEQRDALCDHELEHLELRLKDGAIVRDDIDRPKLKLKPHDWEVWGFRSIVNRHKAAALEASAAAQFIQGPDGQLVMQFAGIG